MQLNKEDIQLVKDALRYYQTIIQREMIREGNLPLTTRECIKADIKIEELLTRLIGV